MIPAALIEKMGRPGLLGLIGKKLERRATDRFEQYFKSLSRRIAALGLEQLAAVDNVEIARHVAEMKLGNVIRVYTPLLQALLQFTIEDGMQAADKIHHFAEASDDEDLPKPLITGEEASIYAATRAGELISGINQVTLGQIQDAVSTGITDRLGVQGTARLIRATLADMTRLRSERIASTELNDAFSEATVRKLNRLGIEYKVWIVSTACCDDCADNEDAGAIPVTSLFPSGDERPPAHPNCRCAVSGARPPE